MKSLQSKIPIITILLFLAFQINAQIPERRPFLEPSDTLNKARFWTCAGTGFAVYAGFSILLYEAWYKDHEITNFQFFDDRGEWLDMDKVGHSFTAYLETRLTFDGARWVGMDRRTAMWTGAGIGFLLQSTVEVMDGFSEKWGFSVADMAFNTAGIGLFIGQELLWQEQRISFKVSSTRPQYSDNPILASDGTAFSSARQRATELYGNSFAEAFLKDYNAQTLWASVNIHSFLGKQRHHSRFPKWLNIAVGYGGENMFGGYGNSWTDEEGNSFYLPASTHPRYRQIFFSLDVDLSRIKTKSRFWNSFLRAFNFIKIPAPTLELKMNGGVHLHSFYW